jgi:hypothetical protein
MVSVDGTSDAGGYEISPCDDGRAMGALTRFRIVGAEGRVISVLPNRSTVRSPQRGDDFGVAPTVHRVEHPG